MKKALSLALVILMLLTLCSCGKAPSVTNLVEYPVGTTSIRDYEKFVKSCGYKVENTTDQYVSFTDGTWDGMATPTGITLSLNTIGIGNEEFDKEIEAVRQELRSLCGEPYASQSSQMHPMTNEFYAYGDKVVAVTIITSPMKSMNIAIMPAPQA